MFTTWYLKPSKGCKSPQNSTNSTSCPNRSFGKELELKTINSNWNNIWIIKKLFLGWKKTSSQISKHIHSLECKQCFDGVVTNMFLR